MLTRIEVQIWYKNMRGKRRAEIGANEMPKKKVLEPRLEVSLMVWRSEDGS